MNYKKYEKVLKKPKNVMILIVELLIPKKLSREQKVH